MNRKVHTSSGKRKLYHQVEHNNYLSDNNIIRPPTAHPYTSLNEYRGSIKLRNQYDSNYFNGKMFGDRKNVQSHLNLLQKETRHKSSFERELNLPKGFKHSFAQIKILLRNKSIDQEEWKEVLKSLAHKVKQIVAQVQELKNKLEQTQKQLSNNEKQKSSLSSKLKSLNPGQIYRRNQNFLTKEQSQKSRAKKQTENSLNTLIIQNVRLQNLNLTYLNTIQQLQRQLQATQRSVENIKNKGESHESDRSTEFLKFNNRISYLQMKITNSEKLQQELQTQNQRLQETIDLLNKHLNWQKEEKSKAISNRNQWRERALMQKQDSQTHLNRQNFLLFSIKKLRQTNKNLVQKLLNVHNPDSNSKIIKEIEQNPYFQYEVDFFKSIKTVYFQAKYKQHRIMLQNKRETINVEEIGLEEQYVNYRKHEEIDLVSLNYYKPSFFSFIEQCLSSDFQSCRVRGSTSVSRIFIQILRAIMNCKINQFMMSDSEVKFTRFPEFVYSWFEKFYFNSQKNTVLALEPYMQKPVSQDSFYKDLMNIKLDQSWQIITFRQFLLEQLNLQQLYFYLMCQSLLFKKGAITQELQYQGEFCILVEYSLAKSVLDLVLSDFESWNISFLTSKLREKVIVKKNIQFIESGFFLRCLIQYYKIQRINRFKYIAKLCDEFKSCEQNGLRFSSFISVINRFTEISYEQKLRLYRDCFSVSNGKITADVIYTVCTEQLVFLRYLKLKCFYKLPVNLTHKEVRHNKNQKQLSIQNKDTVQKKKQPLYLQPGDSYIYDIFMGFRNFFDDQENFDKQIQKIGYSELYLYFEHLKKIMGEKSGSADSSALRCKHFVHYVSKAMEKVRQLTFNNFYDLINQNNKKKARASFWIQTDEAELCGLFTQQFKLTFAIYQKLNNYRLWKEEVYKFRQNNAARKIQRQVRKKFIEPLMQLYKIIYSDKKRPKLQTSDSKLRSKK